MQIIDFLNSFAIAVFALGAPTQAAAEDSASEAYERKIAIVQVTLEDAQGRAVQRETHAVNWGGQARFELQGAGEASVVELDVRPAAQGSANVSSSYRASEGYEERRHVRADFGAPMVAHADADSRVLVTVRSARVRLQTR